MKLPREGVMLCHEDQFLKEGEDGVGVERESPARNKGMGAWKNMGYICSK